MEDLKLPDKVGYACFRYCTKYKLFRDHISSNCVKWETDILDLKKREDFVKFRDAGFVLSIGDK